MCALVTKKNDIFVHKLIYDDSDSNGNAFVTNRTFNQHKRVFVHPQSPAYLNVIDLLIIKNPNFKFGEGQYSMYVVSEHGILLYESIDKPGSDTVLKIANDLPNINLSPLCIDCNP